MVFDTEVYSNTGGQSSKSTNIGAIAQFAAGGKDVKKKDLASIAMSYGYVYVAQIAMGADMNQCVKAIAEAEAYPGPSLIIAYAPCINHGIKIGMSKAQTEEKNAVAVGYWNNFRYNPALAAEGKNAFTLDSKAPSGDYKAFLNGEVRYNALVRQDPEKADRLFEKSEENAKARYRLLEALIKEPVIDESIIKSKLNITAQTVKAFEDMGIAEVRSEDMYRNPVRNVLGERKHIELNKQQKKAVDTIIADYDNGDYKTYLLHGVTGSGKTEVYLETIEHVLNHGRQAIVLIPEIALTFQTVQRFYHRFGDKVSIMNSRMSKGERYDQFLRAQRGDISVMIGPRSALFTPFSNIGLIVIDEEHEGAYKSETVPRYHAREVACHIAKEAGASVILGSATPSMESYYAAMNGHIQLITLDSRAGSGGLPAVDIVDLREELRLGNRTIFSNRLRELMSDRLAKHEQIMLFLNKRGVAGFISCRSCGKVMKCPHCDVSLTEHADGRLMCHYCGYTTPKITVCLHAVQDMFRASGQEQKVLKHRLRKHFHRREC
mgnify:CR=1 FL=1